MLTVKHVERDGTERVFEAVDITRLPGGRLAFGQVIEITTGKVYVMNSHGKTVADYDFEKQRP